MEEGLEQLLFLKGELSMKIEEINKLKEAFSAKEREKDREIEFGNIKKL